ncbi:MAG: alpha/beta hydrolase [Cyclobacteriaceae bacterium]|nr:alpha/beta hydrolase [Cyclobacteriaceae bacterium]
MKQHKRREFLRNAAISAGIFGLLPGEINSTATFTPPDPAPEFQDEEILLWQEGSENNGSNPEYRPKIRIYYPAIPKNEMENKKLAAVLICPGGGYYVQAPHEGEPFARLFSLYGIVGVVLTYRVFPDRYPGSYSDACRALRWLRENADKYRIDPQRIGIMGFSAGGHLASTVATQPDLYKNPEDDLAGKFSSRPDRVILGYPVISFVDDYAHQGSAKSLLGEDPDPAMVKQLSNNYQVTADTPPAFLFHTADDQGVPVENSLSFAEACIKNKVPVELHVFPEGRHGVGMAREDPELSIWIENLMNWLRDWHLKP